MNGWDLKILISLVAMIISVYATVDLIIWTWKNRC